MTAAATPARTLTLPGGWILLFLLGLPLPVLAPALHSITAAWALPDYSHGPLIPALALALLLRALAARPLLPARRPGRGMALALAGLSAILTGHAAHLPDLQGAGLLLWLAGLVLAVTGAPRLLWPVAYLAFALPLPQVLFWKLSLTLQLLSSEFGVALLRAASVPVILEGNVIDLGPLQLQVAEACSGLRYLFPLLAFACLIAALYRGPVRHRAVLVLAAAPLAIALNSLRIAAVGLLAGLAGLAPAQGLLHAVEGWAVFGLCLGLLFLLAAGLQRLRARPLPVTAMLDLNTAGWLPAARSGLTLAPTRALRGLAAASLLLLAAYAMLPRPHHAPVLREPFALLPRQVGDWTGAPVPIDAAVARVLAATDAVELRFTAPSQPQPVTLFAAWYARQTDGAAIHSPAICLPVGGWEMAGLSVHTFPGGHAVNRAVIRKGLSRQLVWYWSVQRGTPMTGDLAVKWSILRDSLSRGRSDGALLRLSTPIGPAEDIAAAEARLARLAIALQPAWPRHLPP